MPVEPGSSTNTNISSIATTHTTSNHVGSVRKPTHQRHRVNFHCSLAQVAHTPRKKLCTLLVLVNSPPHNQTINESSLSDALLSLSNAHSQHKKRGEFLSGSRTLQTVLLCLPSGGHNATAMMEFCSTNVIKFRTENPILLANCKLLCNVRMHR